MNAFHWRERPEPIKPKPRKPWADVPENNRNLMIAVVGKVRAIIAKVEGK